MPLVTTPKEGSSNSRTPSAAPVRQQVAMGRPTASTARVEALKARLTGQPAPQPVVPRPARTSQRAEDMAKLQKFNTPAQKPQITPRDPRGRGQVDFSTIAPPPQGLVSQEPVLDTTPSQTPSGIETPEAPPEASSETLSPQFVALARQEKQLQKARRELKAEQDAWKQEQAKYLPKERLTSETLKVLAEAGITPDKLVELQINQASSQDPEQLLLNRITELEAKLNGITDPENGTLAKRDKDAYEAAVLQIRSDAKLLVDSNPAYETIRSEGAHEEVVGLITAVFNEEGIVLDVEEAAKLVEDKLSERMYKQYERISQYQKIKARLGKRTENFAEASSEQLSLQPPKINTLTNAGASQRAMSARDRAVLAVQARLDALKGK